MDKKNKLYIKNKVKPYLFLFTMLLLGTIFSTIISAIYPYIFSIIIDEVFYNKQIHMLIKYVFLYLIVFIVNQSLYFVVNISWAKLNTSFVFDIRRDMYNKVISYKSKVLTKLRTGDIISRMSGDSTQLFNYIYWNIFYTITDSLCLIGSLIFIAYYNLKLMLITLIIIPFIVYTARFFAKKVRNKQERIRNETGKLNSWLYEILNGMQEIRLIGAVSNVISKYMKNTNHILRMNVEKDKVEISSERINYFIKLIGITIVYGIAAYYICKDEMTIGGFTACLTYFNLCIKTFDDLNFVILGFSSNSVGIDRVVEVLDGESEDFNRNLPDVEIDSPDVSFKNVVFSYEDDVPLLSGFNLEINHGEKIAIVGHSGSGKTTIANLLYRLYEVKEGSIMIGGKDVRQFNLENLRQQIGVIHQDSVFFEGSIRYNISFSNSKENDDKIWSALESANIADFVKSLPLGLDTVIGTAEGIFSGGQKQRLAIARVLYKKPAIIVFDESTAFLDNVAEEKIKETWDSFGDEVTLIVIAHKASTIKNFNRIVVLENGKLICDGNHNELINDCDMYKELFAI